MMASTYRVSVAPTTEQRRLLTVERYETISAGQEAAEAVVGEDGAGWAEWSDETETETAVCALLSAVDLGADVYTALAIIYRRRLRGQMKGDTE